MDDNSNGLTANIKIDLRSLTGKVGSVIERSSKNIHIIMASVAEWSGDGLSPAQGSEARVKPADLATANDEERKIAVKWAINSAARDISDEINNLLLQCFRYLSFATKLTEQRVQIQYGQLQDVETLIDEIVGVRNVRSFDRMGIEKKISEMAEKLDIDLVNAETLIAFGKFRNCLSHRNGIIGIQDCNTDEHDPRLEFAATLPVLQAGLPNEEPAPVQIGVTIPAGSNVVLKMTPQKFTWALNDTISLSDREFDTITFTVLQACLSATQQVNDRFNEITTTAS